jgi:hypothetical protein
MIRPWLNTWKNKKGFNAEIAILSVLIVVFVGYLFWYPALGKDAGYYLKIAFDLSHGLRYYNEINCNYNPLVLYLFALPFKLFGEVPLLLLVTLHYLMYPALGWVFYKTLAIIGAPKTLQYLFPFILIMANLILDGVYIMLEVYVLVFQLCALLFLLGSQNKPYTGQFMAGICLFLAFYAKQYGLFILPSLLYWNVVNSGSTKGFLKLVIYLGLGFIIPLLATFMYFHFKEQTSISVFFWRIIGQSAVANELPITGIYSTFQGRLERIWQFLLKFPFVLLVIVPLWLRKPRNQFSNLALLLLLGSFSPLLFAYYDHYFQFATTYLLLTLATFHGVSKWNHFNAVRVICWCFILVSCTKFPKILTKRKMAHLNQTYNTPLIEKALPKHTPVFLHGLGTQYQYLAKFNSANAQVLGYKFPEEFHFQDIPKHMEKGSYIVVDPKIEKRTELISFERVHQLRLRDKTIFILRKP